MDCKALTVRVQSATGRGLEIPSFVIRVCILLAFCAAVVIPFLAQSVAFTTLANFDWTNGRFPVGISRSGRRRKLLWHNGIWRGKQQ